MGSQVVQLDLKFMILLLQPLVLCLLGDGPLTNRVLFLCV